MARKPLFSGNYGSALARVDTAPIVGAGRAQGQTFQQIGGMIQQYGLNKEKQKKNQAFIKGQSNLLDMLSEQDPEQADRYAIMKEQLNNPDVSLTERTELGKQLMQNVTLSNQMQNQMLSRKTQEQALDTAKKLQESQITIANLKAEIAGKTKDDVIRGVGAKTRGQEAETDMLEVDSAYYKTDKEVERDSKRSLTNYRNANTLSMVLKQNNINAPVPQDLEKRFSDIATQLGKNDDSKVKVRTSGILGGDEVEITYSDYKENPNDYAPLVNNEIKALQANEERLIKERTNVIQGFKIPIIDKETGEQIFITLLEKMEYDEKRKQLQDQEDSKRSLDQNSGYMSGMNMDYSNLDPSVAELMAGSGATQP